MLRDRARLGKLLRNSKRPVQILFAGKSHPANQPGKVDLHKFPGGIVPTKMPPKRLHGRIPSGRGR